MDTVDLVSSHGLPVCNLVISDQVFLDHMPVLFEMNLSCIKAKLCAAARFCHVFNSSTAGQFSSVYNEVCHPRNGAINLMISAHALPPPTKQFWVLWVHYKIRHPRPKSESWLNSDTQAARRELSADGRLINYRSVQI
ncbi:hypothetical protein XENOCAPTIV_021967 [Xenoophorus captivus]|uniref:Uncharacterized protein n=1 Tax=Xenoophorus captivus TaxID=1517983 RepID=A0ABV0S045_9TELE